MSTFPTIRPRRLRTHPTLRQLVRQTHLQAHQLVLPLFVRPGQNEARPITSLPGHAQYSVDRLPEIATVAWTAGIRSVILFGIPPHKDAMGSDSCHEDGIIQQAIRQLRRSHPEMIIIADVCFCEYTDHGHCGVLSANQQDVDNDATLQQLAAQAVSYAQAGAHILAPSGMMDGMVAALRRGLDAANFSHLPILSYAVKYASALYGPFRQAAEGAPQFGDRRTYQMDPANGREALREAQLDVAEGADMLLVKPAHTYLDILWQVHQQHPELPLVAYHTSGEYAMIKAAASLGALEEKAAFWEVLTAIKRAGADLIITYAALQMAQWLSTPDTDLP